MGSIPVIYEDDWLLIAEKPPGLLVVPAPGTGGRTLTAIVNDELKDRTASYHLHPCHRLDRETSGLVMFAKGKAAQEKFMQLFSDRSIKKTYQAFVHGRLAHARGRITSPIENKPALTDYRVVAQKDDFAVVEVMPQTGRTNQIRIHFKAIGHPLVGESRFAFRKDFRLRAKRLMLHAHALEFTHPFTGKPMRVESGPARDMQRFLEGHQA
ncbi:MAG: RluA family pseudouridine synthase [Candidatus Omnitrophica bacterium]|nr:RluA family pseudouridine synthase [Candidatus Omnitrophota bacterium]